MLVSLRQIYPNYVRSLFQLKMKVVSRRIRKEKKGPVVRRAEVEGGDRAIRLDEALDILALVLISTGKESTMTLKYTDMLFPC